MQFLIVLTAVLALASANPGYLGAGYLGAYHGGYASNILTPSGDTVEVAAAKANHFQAHANARAGIVGAGVGAYHGGYASNFLTPSGDTVEVAAAKANHFQAHANARAGLVGAGVGVYGAGPLVDPVAIAAGAPLPVGDTHEVAAAKAAHFQAHIDAKAGHVGAHAYGAYGAYGVYGAYPGIHAAYGTAQIVDPVAIAAGAPLPVSDTYEVAAAKAAHFQAHVEAKHGLLGRKKRSPGYLGYAAPIHSYGYSHVGAYASPLVYGAHSYLY